MAMTAAQVAAALTCLRESDPVLRAMIDEVGKFRLRPERDRFAMLVRSILSQQISVGAARAIRQRLEQRLAPGGITPEGLLVLDVGELRSVGLSAQKALYIRDLAMKACDGTLQLRTIGRLPDEEIIQQLRQVKGIGRWTAQMFLIFALGRPDVFPEDDLGVRTAIRDRYGLSDLPDRATSLEIARSWRPYASIASWYCWRTLELKRKATSSGTGYPT